MPYELHLRHYDRSGILKKSVLSPLWARFTDSLDGDEPLVFALNEEDPAAADVEEFDIMEVLIRNKALGIQDGNGGFVRAFVGIVRDWELDTDDDGLTFWQFKAPNERHILSWRAILYYAGVNNRSDFSNKPAETIMKTLVQYNCTASASTGNGRHRDGDLATGMGIDITVAADQARGYDLSAAFMGGNLLSVLEKLNEQAGGDFSLTWQGLNDWTFEFHEGQLGTDKSNGSERVLFSLKNNTIRNPRLRRYGAKATVAIAGGQGRDETRQISEVEGPDFAVDYDIETFVDARNETTPEGRIFRGAARLEETKVVEELSFGVLQTAGQFYSPVAVSGRKTYKTGDLVLATYGLEQVRKIQRIEVKWQVPRSEDPFQVDIATREVVYAGS